ncbi:hypothetical protein ACH5RR_020624 [Cinchona calisaya]|uniref:BZIP domain-containing protein n=1 Tax=Cinchona calisaya TaxID=153742 RepID=A0ABD2ZIC3_9GENT
MEGSKPIKPSRGASKPPLYPKFNKSSMNPSPLRMMFPSTLANENSPYHDLPSGAGQNVAISPQEVVNSNMPHSLHVHCEGEGFLNQNFETENITNYSSIDKNFENEESRKGKRMMTFIEAVENEKKGRTLPIPVERQLRRTVSNRLSAQRSRLKKSQYIIELKRATQKLEENATYLTVEVDKWTHKKATVKMHNSILKQQLKTKINESILSNSEIEEKQAEIRRLRALYKAQQEEITMRPTAPIVESSTSNLFFYPSESNFQTVFSPKYDFFQSDPKPAPMEISTDDGDIDQYLNLDALSLPPF